MIAVMLLAIVGSIIGIRISRALDEKQFQTAVNRLYIELESCRQMALNMQADWTAVLEKKGKRFVLQRLCPETAKSGAFEWAAPCELVWNGEKIQQIAFLFAASGKISPQGQLEIIGTQRKVHWALPQIFMLDEGIGGAMPRPDDKNDSLKLK
ncbi:MAG: hypothetical protein HW387_660 [Parachlamydiales bacterium]|nr:hypothetical protein [Parachlamydiales bacterium]